MDCEGRSRVGQPWCSGSDGQAGGDGEKWEVLGRPAADPRGEELTPEGRARASKEEEREGGQGGAGAGVWNAGSLRAQPQRRQVSGVPRPTLPGHLALML